MNGADNVERFKKKKNKRSTNESIVNVNYSIRNLDKAHI